MQKRTLTFIFLAVVFITQSAFATLNLELTKGTNNRRPIAVMPFAWHGSTQQPLLHISQVVRNDLINSGMFNVVDNTQFNQLPETSTQVNINYWRKQQVNALLIGQVQSQGNGQYRVTFSLINVYKNKDQTPVLNNNAINPQASAVLVTKTYTVSANKLRNTAHVISNIVYKQLIGIKGYFTSKIAFVLIQNPGKANQQYTLDVSDYDGFNVRPILISSEPIMSPAWSPDRHSIAYVSYESGLPAIYSTNILNMNRKKLTSFPGINGSPSYSPTTNQLALVLSKNTNPDIYLLDLDSSDLTKVTSNWASDTKPVWMPTGKSIVFTSDRSGTPQIYQLDLAAKKTKKLTDKGVYNADPAVSPDGNWLAFMTKFDGSYFIALRNLNDASQRMLTVAQSESSPSFSPNSGAVIYSVVLKGKNVLVESSLSGQVNYLLPRLNGNMVQPVWQ